MAVYDKPETDLQPPKRSQSKRAMMEANNAKWEAMQPSIPQLMAQGVKQRAGQAAGLVRSVMDPKPADTDLMPQPRKPGPFSVRDHATGSWR